MSEPTTEQECRELLANEDAIFIDDYWVCPKCFYSLASFSGEEELPAYDYCPNCMDWAYADGMRIARLV